MKKEKIDNWIKEFDELFVIYYPNGAEWKILETRSSVGQVKVFICQLLRQKQLEILKRIKLERLTVREWGQDIIRGYNQAITDLERLKKEIKKELWKKNLRQKTKN